MYIAISLLGITGAIAAFILFFLSKKFEVKEDPRMALVLEALPGVNCGGCGYPGCGGFAAACVKAASLEGLACPVGGAEVMKSVATIMGRDAGETIPQVAVVRCNGTCDVRPRTNIYDGAPSCAIASSLYGGDTGCSFGCLGLGDCVDACAFDAIHINLTTGLAEVTEEKCVACKACVKACPKNIIEMRKKGPKSRRIFVSCMNKDKGGAARKACQNACIGCGKCAKECAFEAITITSNLAFIDDTKCRLCRKCAAVCPTGAIHELNFPPRKTAEEKKAAGDIAVTKTTAENPAKNPAENPAENPTENPAENPAENPTENPAKNPAKNPAENPAENPTENPAENPAENPTENPTKNPAENPAKEPVAVKAVIETPITQPAENVPKQKPEAL